MIESIIQQTSLMEWLGVILSIFQVVLSRQNSPVNYLFGIAGIIITMIVMFNALLFAEFALNIYYLVMSVYGWAYWKFGKSKQEVPISYTDQSEKLKTVSIVVGSFAVLYFALTTFTTSDVPVWDAIVSAFAWAGMWLMAKRKMENWILLNISNLISIPLMVYKSLYLYAILSGILFIVAISGYFNWRSILKKQSIVSNDSKIIKTVPASI